MAQVKRQDDTLEASVEPWTNIRQAGAAYNMGRWGGQVNLEIVLQCCERTRLEDGAWRSMGPKGLGSQCSHWGPA